MRSHFQVAGRALFVSLLAAAPLGASAFGQAGDRKNEVQGDLPADLVIPPAPVLTPEEEHATFALPKGFEIELVAAEPLVVDPVQIVFDETGRLWVVEMRGYMPDIDGNGELDPTGVIAVLSDTDGDGQMDQRDEFAKDLVLPRGVVPMHGGALCILPPELVFLRDDDGDGAFDTREVVATGLKQGLANPEHAINSPLLGIDNWVHFANWNKRVRRIFDEDGNPSWQVEPVRGGGQWGLSMDDVGRLMRNTNPNPLYCDLVPSRYAVRNGHQRRFDGAFAGVDAKNATFPSRINPGVNRGYQEATLRDDFTLAAFTAACGPTVLRGDGLGADANGDIFVCEPTGNLVKRYELNPKDGSARLVAKSLHAEFDFLTSTHERFRPVAATTGPDGSLFLADMYRGLVQHRIFLTSFLRKQIVERELAGPMGLGRIWRVVRTDAQAKAPEVDLLDASNLELVSRLDSPNSWVRDYAQRLLVETVDGEASVINALTARCDAGAVGEGGAVSTIHALWTLDGVGFMTPAVLKAALASKDASIRCAALEISSVHINAEGAELVGPIASIATSDRDARARLYGLLALGDSEAGEILEPFARRMTADAAASLERSAVVSGLEYREADMLFHLAALPEWAVEKAGRASLIKDLALCVGREGLYENVERLVDLALDPPAAWWSQNVLDGLYATRRKGPKGQRLPLPLRAMPAGLTLAATEEGTPAATLFAKVDEGCTWPGKPGAVPVEIPRELTEAEKLAFERGAVVFGEACATCHQTHGGGQDGKAPTLRGTRFSVGDEGRLIRILMHGLEGPLDIDGVTWNQEMPRYEGTDADLAAVLTYVRRSWGNGADPVSAERVAKERAKADGRTRPMTPSEIDG